MSSLQRMLFYPLLTILFFVSCSEKVNPEEEAKKQKAKIIKEAPIDIEYKINPPGENISENLKLLSGKWVGRWNDIVPCQLIITDINSYEATIIYSWGAIPQREVEAGSFTKTVKINSDAKIIFELDSAITTFVANTTLKKLIGAQINGDEVSNIVMDKVE